MRNVITAMDALGDVYAFTVQIPSDVYEIKCGDSWVVATTGISPRRGVINDKTINSSGVTYVSSGEIVSLNSEKALEEDEIEDLVQEIDDMFRIIRVDRFIIKDTILNEVYQIVDEPYVFTPENGMFISADLAFDITSHFDTLYLGLETEIILENGHICRAQVVNNEFIIKDPQVMPPKLVKLNDIVIKDANGGTLYRKSDEVTWETEKDTFGNNNYFVVHYNDSSGYVDYQWDSNLPAPYNRISGDNGKFLYFLSDGATHTLPIPSNDHYDYQVFAIGNIGVLMFENIYGMFYFCGSLEAKYNQTTGILEIKLIPLALQQNITIQSVTVTNSQDT